MLSCGSRQRPRSQRGLSIVELMVGIAIGLIIVAAASLLMSGQLNENRRLLAETQLQQDLRAASDIITRELRRVGAAFETQSLQSLWFPGRTTAVQENLLSSPVTIEPAAGTSASEVKFTYNPGGAGIGIFGYRLQNGGIQTRMAAGGWQELTDPRVMTVNTFTITRDADSEIRLPCAKLCPDPPYTPPYTYTPPHTDCWPKLRIRNLSVNITASAVADSGISRSIRTRVRVRNDYLGFEPNPALPGQVCPP